MVVYATCLPILVVDEDIYKWCPSLLISTIDKFAQISWRENIGSLFGKTDAYCAKFLSKTAVPEIIMCVRQVSFLNFNY